MTQEIENGIRVACIQALNALGDNYKGLSWFLYNWKGQESQDEDGLRDAA